MNDDQTIDGEDETLDGILDVDATGMVQSHVEIVSAEIDEAVSGEGAEGDV